MRDRVPDQSFKDVGPLRGIGEGSMYAETLTVVALVLFSAIFGLHSELEA